MSPIHIEQAVQSYCNCNGQDMFYEKARTRLAHLSEAIKRNGMCLRTLAQELEVKSSAGIVHNEEKDILEFSGNQKHCGGIRDVVIVSGVGLGK